MSIAISVVFPLGAILDAPFEQRQILADFQEVDPVVEGFVGIGFADVDKMKAIEQGLSAEGLVGVNVIAEQGGLQPGVERGVFVQPAFGGGDFTVLFGVAILGRHKLRA